MGADLGGANLWGADLRGADLMGANLRGANLGGVDLRGADLGGANLRDADLRRANLVGANLWGAYLKDADLANTVLDPMRAPNGQCDKFERYGDWCAGYRTGAPVYLGSEPYAVGEWYTAPYFSVASTECHPGLYVFPSIRNVKAWLASEQKMSDRFVKVLFRPWECHQAGEKWRVTGFLVWEEIWKN